MDQQRVQAIEIGVVACAFALSVFFLARRGRLSFRYTIGWLTLSFLSALGGFLLPLIEPLARKLQLDAFSLLGAISVVVLLGLCIQLSISISGLQRQVQKLNEDIALRTNFLDDGCDSAK